MSKLKTLFIFLLCFSLMGQVLADTIPAACSMLESLPLTASDKAFKGQQRLNHKVHHTAEQHSPMEMECCGSENSCEMEICRSACTISIGLFINFSVSVLSSCATHFMTHAKPWTSLATPPHLRPPISI